jgi:hypothetical protein
MHLELQFAAQKLINTLRQRFLQQRVCISDPIVVTAGPGQSVTYYFDHLTISSDTHFQRIDSNDILVYGTDHVQGCNLQLVQPISVFVATLQDLQTADDQPAPYQQFDFNITFDVFMSNDKDGWMLHVDFKDLVSTMGLPVPAEIKDTVKQILAGQTTDAHRPFAAEGPDRRGFCCGGSLRWQRFSVRHQFENHADRASLREDAARRAIGG